ncbi:MAG: hypothetical protein ABIF18_00215, partial [archaeon]
MNYELEQNLSSTIEAGLNINFWLLILIWIIVFVVIILITKKIIHLVFIKNKYFDHSIYLIKLQKEKPSDNEREAENKVQQLHEQIAIGETIFSSIGGLRAPRGIVPWLFGRNDHFSFEVVANQKTITFYVVSPREMARYLEQQIQAHYPDAVMEEVEDYNIFSYGGETIAKNLKTKKDYIFPIKTYKKMET